MTRVLLSAPAAEADRIHDPRHARGFEGDRFGHQALEVRIDHTAQIHHMIQSPHIEEIGRLQCRMLIEQRLYRGRDFRVAGAPGESALPVHRTSRKSLRQEDGESQRQKSLVTSHGNSVCISPR
jgi:hypothetical protein